jgi:4-amino-4-deoxy-L-arabinose transferase
LALAGAAVFLTCGLVFGIGTYSVLDGPFSAFVTGTMAGFFCAYQEPRQAKKIVYLVLSGVSCGLAFLTKGFLAFALPLVAIVPFLAWERRWKAMLSYPWIPLLAAVVVVLPWGLWVHLREHDFWHYFFWEEHIRRFFSDKAQHPAPLWFFIPILLGGALPWTPLLGAAIKGLNTRWRDAMIRFAFCWAMCMFLFLSASRGKLVTYILPCFPPLAILLCVGMVTSLSRSASRGHTRVVYGCAAILCILAVAAPAVGAVFPVARIYGPSETWKWAALAVGLVSYAAVLILSERQPTALRKLACYCAGPAILFFVAAFAVPQRLVARVAPEAFLRRHAQDVHPETLVVLDERLAPAACWTYRRTDVAVLEMGGELDYGLSYEDARGRLVTVGQLNGLIKDSSRTRPIALIARTKPYAQWAKQLAKPDAVDTDGHSVFATFLAPRAGVAWSLAR